MTSGDFISIHVCLSVCLSVCWFYVVLQPQHHPPTPVDGNIDSDDQIVYVRAFCLLVGWIVDIAVSWMISWWYGSFPPGPGSRPTDRQTDGRTITRSGLRSFATCHPQQCMYVYCFSSWFARRGGALLLSIQVPPTRLDSTGLVQCMAGGARPSSIAASVLTGTSSLSL